MPKARDKAQTALHKDFGRTEGERDKFNTNLWSQYGGARDRDDEVRNMFLDRNSADRGMFSDWARTGGWSPRDRADVERNIGSFRELEGRGREWADTGGYTPEMDANYRARATSVIPSFYSALQDDLGRQNVATGGFNPGFTSQMASLARERSRAGTDAAREAEADIDTRRHAGQLEGMGIWRSAAGDANDARMGLVNSINSGRQFGASGMANTTQDLLRLYGMAPGESSALLQAIAQSMGQGADERYRYYNNRLQNSPTFMQQWLPWLQAGGTFAGAFA